jgi:hypothetical protein
MGAMNKAFVALGVVLLLAGVFVAYYTGVGLQHDFTAVKIIANISSFLIIIGFIAVGALMIYTGVKKNPKW